MKNIRALLCAAILAVAVVVSVPAHGGNIETGVVPPPPPPAESTAQQSDSNAPPAEESGYLDLFTAATIDIMSCLLAIY
ncbi:MAG TPA: hypothetical protein VF723_11365 [Pyrinomonadaceae bacterium]